jgi:signal transduction histidine kinase
MLDRPAWELTTRDVERWTGHPVTAEAARKMFSAVSEAIWNRREQADHSHQIVVVDQLPVTLLWQVRGATAVVLALSPTVVNSWLEDAGYAESTERARVSVVASSGEIVAGPAPSAAHSTVRASASDTGLPWTVVLTASESPATTAEFVSRRRLLSIALAAMLLLLAGTSYFLWRVMQRELEVGRLQTDFVSAVSHEFRTPLTSLRHVTELLEENDELPRERRRAFYAALDRNTERLHRLVESLLDFARMEGGRKPYEFRTVDGGALAVQVVAEFQKEVAERGYRLDLHVAPEAAILLHVDASSLTNALWNLLDNAVKYSPDHHVIHVSLDNHPAGVAIAVTDHGLGIPAHERRQIFERFVRGEKAQQLGIHGTGLGLAMVSHIVRAHGGTVELESVEGSGSTFTMVLPVHPHSHAAGAVGAEA